MNTLKQLLRQPVRTIAALLLLILASAFLSMATGMLLSSRATSDAIERRFVTIAAPSNEYVKSDSPDGMVEYSPLVTYEMIQFIDELTKTCPAIKGMYDHGFISAYCPQLSTAISAQQDGQYSPGHDGHYEGVVLDITLTEGDEDGSGSTYWAKVNKAIVMHPGFEIRERLHVDFTFNSTEEFEAAQLHAGGRYLIYADSYLDNELQQKQRIMQSINCSIDEVDWNNIDLLDPEEYEIMPGSLEPTEIVAYYRDEERGVAVSMTQNDLDSIGSGSVIIQDLSGYYLDRFNSPDAQDFEKYPSGLDGTRLTIPYYEIYHAPTVTPLNENADVDAFLASDEGKEWAYYIEQLQTRLHCVPVIGTDLLESIYPFQRMSAFIVDGRTLSDADYASGNKVCIISEITAQQSGLSIGDRIDLSFYWGASCNSGGESGEMNDVVAQPFYNKLGFSGDAQEYEIVGIYRQSDPWDTSETIRFNPNTIFMPKASIGQPCFEGDTGIYSTLVLNNGGVDEVKQAIADAGYPENILLYFDGGYGEMQDTLRGFNESAVQLFAVSCVALIAAMAVYLVLFVLRQQRTVGLMLSLGAGKGGARGFVWRFSMLPVLISALIGGAIGALFLQSALHRTLATVSEALSPSFSSAATSSGAMLDGMMVSMPWSSAVAAVVFAALFAVVIWLCTIYIARKPLLRLLKK